MPDNIASTTPPRYTQRQYAALHGKSLSVVKKLVAQGRLPYERVGGGEHRAAAVIILTDKWPDPVPRGSLTSDQRAAWNKGRRGKPAATPAA